MASPASDARRVANPPPRPLLVYDGDCTFCRIWIARWRARTGTAVDYETSETAAPRYPDCEASWFRESVVLILPDGAVRTGAGAALGALRAAGRARLIGWAFDHLPGFAPAAEACYRFIAHRRGLASRATRILWGRHVVPPAFSVARCVFIRLLAVVHLVAFLSLWSQIDALIGRDGILPAAAFLEAVQDQTGPGRYWDFPTLAWVRADDAFLHMMCGAGAAIAVLVMLGFLPGPGLACLWVLYLSLTTVGQTFLRFQWDNLLLEAGFLGVCLAPWGWRCRIGCRSGPSRLALAMAWWLIFRLMFSSGVVKLSSGDPTWWDLTALQYHYETQPIPAWTSWYVHQIPGWVQRFSTLVMFAIELGAPLLIVAPRRMRHAAAAALAGLQILIALTGNYGFFNLLSCALLVLLCDDTIWPAAWPRAAASSRRRAPILLIPVAACYLLLGAVSLVGAFRTGWEWPAPVNALARAAAPLRTVNGYGLFSVMTTSRPEIVIEGSDDGRSFEPYAFRWKPGDPARAPAFTGPHMPRLDWQMWFAALGSPRSQPWIVPFLQRLLEGSPEVLALIDHDPFTGRPPRFVRAVLYDYRFTDPPTRREEGTWWSRRRLRDYTPTLRLPGDHGSSGSPDSPEQEEEP